MFDTVKFLKKCINRLIVLVQYCCVSVNNRFSRICFSKRLKPLSSKFGFDRGKPIDRYYIEKFLTLYSDDIRGSVLEIGDDAYTKFFGKDKVIRSDVLHAGSGNPRATIIADLAHADNIQSDSFDCIILTQTLQFIYDVDAAAQNIHRILKRGGVLLATVPGISQISSYDMDRWGDYWRFTDLSARRIFESYFDKQNLKIETYGNVLVAISFLHGLSVNEIKKKALEYKDNDYQVVVTLRAVK